MNNDDSFSVEGYPIGADLEYNLHEGANLISFPAEGVYAIEDVLPDNLQGIIYGIIAEGESALYTDGGWIGLENFAGGKGYWIKTYEDLSFNFDIDPVEFAMAKDIVYESKNSKLANFEFVQSSEQAFYFVKNVESAVDGDWIIAYNEDVVVGAREWKDKIVDIPVMGFMGNDYDYSYNYCKSGDVPKFKLYKSISGELIDLEGDIQPFVSNNITILGDLKEKSSILPTEFGISKVYPNPFNPVTTIEFTIPDYSPLSIKILNLQGRVVETIVDENYEPGSYSIKYNATNLSSGVYFVELKNTKHVSYSKIILLK